MRRITPLIGGAATGARKVGGKDHAVMIAEKQLDSTFRAAIEALYKLVPDLPAPVAEAKQEATPMSMLASDPKKEDTSKYKYFPQPTLIQGCVDQVHEYWWDITEGTGGLVSSQEPAA